MLTTFLATLTPMLMLFFCILVGFVARKTQILPENAGKVMAKLETWIFCPALNIVTMATYCSPASLGQHGVNVTLSAIAVCLSVGIAIPLSRLFVREKSPLRGIYMYALAFANSGYMGDPIVQALFGDAALSYYKLYCLPVTLGIYTWGISVLVPNGAQKGSVWKKILNAPTVAMFLGMAVGLCGLGQYMPAFVVNSLNALKACMGPVAMLLAGFTIAGYSLPRMLKNGRVYGASLLRLTLLPAVLIVVLFAVQTLAEGLFSVSIGNAALFLCFFATATPLG